MKQARLYWEPHWAAVSDNTQSRRSRFLRYSGTTAGQAAMVGWNDASKAINTKLLDGTGRKCSRVLGNGLASGLCSENRPWFKLTTADPDLAKRADVKIWLSDVQRALYNLFSKSNFYGAVKSGFTENGLFGIETALMTWHPMYGLVTNALTAGEFWVATNDALAVDTLYRTCPMTVAQMVSKFGNKVSPNVMRMYDRSAYDTPVPVMHAIEPNPERVPARVDNTNMVYRSVYWEPGVDKAMSGGGILEFSGFKQKPFWAARWEPMGAQPYSGCPGMDALGDLRQLQLQQLRKTQSVDIMNKPPMRAPIAMESRHINNIPGGITYSSPQDKDAWGPLYQINPDIKDLREDIGETQDQVKDAFFYQLFLAIMDQEREITATEANLLADEKWGQLGPVIDGTIFEKLHVCVDIAFNMLLTTGQLPPWPDSLQGGMIKAQFISVLAQLQRAAEITAIEQTVAFTGQLGGVDPGAWDNIDIDQTIEMYADMRGLPPQLIRPADAVAKLRQARARQQQIATMQAAAPAAKDGAAAAQIAANTPVGSGNRSLLDQLTGAGGGENYRVGNN